MLRAQIVSLCARGLSPVAIAQKVRCSERTVRKWRARFSESPSLGALKDRSRSGRPAVVSVTTRCEVVKLACQRPEDSKAPFRQVWTLGSLQEALREQTGWRLSRSEIQRILHAELLRPHRMRLWLHSPDPEFQSKVERICQLYLQPPEGATVLCVDEKSGIQALERRYPTQSPRRGEPGRFEFEYRRHGTRTLLAAFETRTGQVFGRCGASRKASDLLSFLEAVAERYPTGPVYVIWDNLNIHHGDRWELFNQRHGGRFHFVYTPLHASWVNQVEIWFGVLQRRILRYASFSCLEDLDKALLAFLDHWNAAEAHPWKWTFRGQSRVKTSSYRLAA
ncbi:MAG TPA: IS630 family transposase [Thermoanaerobaculia bacterium]|nr:IS630 family transposase [Thermoanaerobaculia bacterium]